MRLLIIVFLFLVVMPQSVISQDETLEKVRLTYYKSVEDEDYLDTLQTYINYARDKSFSNNESILLAYEGAIASVKAKHAFWPFTKMSYLSESMDTLQKAINMDENNLEIRFIRFSILHYVPGILGYGDELNQDLTKIVELLEDESYSSLTDSIVNGISDFLIESERLTQDQLNRIDNKRILSKN
jgi:hypothetical protein